MVKYKQETPHSARFPCEILIFPPWLVHCYCNSFISLQNVFSWIPSREDFDFQPHIQAEIKILVFTLAF